ncbi:MAG: HAMP domain-containing histidine kinase [Bacteroidetes bacterium]|nr:HAMP domain-containing histidine kinase [Bacteroidota bacterium]
MKTGNHVMRGFGLKWLGMLFLTCGCLLNLRAQRLDQDIESLAVLPQDSSRVLALCRISEATLRDYPDSAMGIASQAMSLSRKIGYAHGQAKARLLQTRAFVAQGELDDADASLEICQSEFGQANDLHGLAECALVEAEMDIARHGWNNALAACHRADSLLAGDSLAWWAPDHLRGKLFQELGSLDQAGKYFEAAIRAASAAGDVRGRAIAGEALGNVLLAQGRNDSAATQHRAAFDAWKASGDRNGQLVTLTGEGTATTRSGKPEKGLQILNRAYGLAKEDRAVYRAGLALIKIAEAEIKLGLPDSAQRRCYDALALLRNRTEAGPALDARIGIVQAALIRSDYGRAMRHGDSAIAIADSLKLYKPLSTVNQLLSKAYETQGDWRRALDHFQRATVARDSLQRQKERNQSLALQVRLDDEADFGNRQETQQAVADAKSASKDLRQTRMLLWICLAALVLSLAGGLFFLLRSRRNAAQVRQLLEEKDEELGESKQELARVSTRLQASNIDYDAVVAERTETLQDAVESLIAENEALGEFVYHSANDLLGPVARLKGLVMMAKSSGQIKDLVQSIDLIEAVSVYMDKILKKIVVVHELKHGFRDIRPVNLEELILDIRPQLKEIPGVKFPDIRLEDHLKRPVMVDKNLIRVILENLLENACVFRRDASNDSPKIDILLQKEDEGILIRIRDEGVGIPNEIRDKIYDLFFRGSEKSKGHGLGLYLVQRALREIGGRVMVESKQGIFTEFTVRFQEMEG